MNKIDVLWIDDECDHKTSDSLIKLASENSINLIGFSCGSFGIEELKSNYNEYDAILLDVKTKYYPNDTDQEKNLNKIKRDLQNIIAKKYSKTPIFYLTSRIPDYIDRLPDDEEDKFFTKGPIEFEGETKLFDQIKKTVENNSLYTVRKTYSDVIKVGEFIDLKIHSSTKKRILDLALHISGEKCDEPFIRIRKILDSMFLFLYEIGEGNEHYISKNSVNLTAAFQYFQYNQTQQRERNGVPDYRILTKSPKFIPLSKKIDKEWKVFINKSSWPTDISTILFYLIGDETPVQALNHEQLEVNDDVESHFQNLKSNKYHSYIYINSLFTLLLWIKKRYIDLDNDF